MHTHVVTSPLFRVSQDVRDHSKTSESSLDVWDVSVLVRAIPSPKSESIPDCLEKTVSFLLQGQTPLPIGLVDLVERGSRGDIQERVEGCTFALSRL